MPSREAKNQQLQHSFIIANQVRKVGDIEELARLGEIIHSGVSRPDGIERFLCLDDDRIKELLKEINEFYQLSELGDWKTYYFARLCLQYIMNKRKEAKR